MHNIQTINTYITYIHTLQLLSKIFLPLKLLSFSLSSAVGRNSSKDLSCSVLSPSSVMVRTLLRTSELESLIRANAIPPFCARFMSIKIIFCFLGSLPAAAFGRADGCACPLDSSMKSLLNSSSSITMSSSMSFAHKLSRDTLLKKKTKY